VGQAAADLGLDGGRVGVRVEPHEDVGGSVMEPLAIERLGDPIVDEDDRVGRERAGAARLADDLQPLAQDLASPGSLIL
jgi:hypothetical protein